MEALNIDLTVSITPDGIAPSVRAIVKDGRERRLGAGETELAPVD